MIEGRARIGITDNLGSERKLEHYIEWIHRTDPKIELVRLSHLLKNEDEIENLDGLLLTGGGDVHPQRYGMADALQSAKGVNELRDEFEFIIIERALGNDLPILGICRGMQLVNVYLGGSLFIDLPSAGYPGHEEETDPERRHDLSIRTDSLLWDICRCERIEVNSSHHQAVQRLGKGLMASATSSDGIVEGAE